MLNKYSEKSWKNIINSLTDIWFSENESLIYISILKLWKSFIADITKDVWLKRSSVINYVENLLSRWIISKIVIWKRIAYIWEKPNNILKDFIKKKEKFEKNLPELNNLFFQNSWQSSVRYFEWKNWILQIYTEILSQFKNIYTFISLEKIINFLWVEKLDELKAMRIKNEIKIKELIKNTDFARNFMKNRKISFWLENKWLPKNFPINIDLLIWWNSIAMISFEKEMWVVIENKDMADFQRNLHNFVWETIK